MRRLTDDNHQHDKRDDEPFCGVHSVFPFQLCPFAEGGIAVDCVNHEICLNTKSAKRNTKGARQLESRTQLQRIFVLFVFFFALFVFLLAYFKAFSISATSRSRSIMPKRE